MQPSVFKRFGAFLSSCYHWDKPFARNVLVVALPMVLQELVGASLHIVDSLMVSGLGDAAYSAVTQANRFSFVFQLFVFGASTGSAIFMSQYWGAKDIARMRQTQGLALASSVLLTLLFTGAALLLPRQIMSCFLPAGESAELGAVYLRTVAPGYLLIAVSNVYATCLKAGEKTYIPMLGGMAGIAVNTLLNYALIYGNFGFPAMGVRGAAIATVISAAIQLAINIGMAYGKKLPAGAGLKQMLCRDGAYVRKYIKTVLPVIFNEGLWSLGTTMYGVFYGRMGDVSVAAMGICSNIDSLVWVFIFGMMNASAIIVGKTLGAGDRDRAYLYAKRLIAGAMLVGAVMGVVLACVRLPLISLFGGLSQAVRDKADIILLLSAATMWFRAFNSINVVGVLRSGGDTVFSLILDVGTMWVVGVPLAALATFVFHWPIELVYLCTFSEEAVKVLLGVPHFKQRKWMNVLTEPKEARANGNA